MEIMIQCKSAVTWQNCVSNSGGAFRISYDIPVTDDFAVKHLINVLS